MSLDFFRGVKLINAIKSAIINHIEEDPEIGLPPDTIEHLINDLEAASEIKKQEMMKLLSISDLRSSFNANIINPKLAAAQIHLMKSVVSRPIDPSNPNSNGTDSPKDWQPV
jgi:hypothetical protein